MTGLDNDRRRWFRIAVLPLETDLKRHARRLCHGISIDPEDLLQDTMEQLFRYENWHGIENVRAFSIATMRNLALQVARRDRVLTIQTMDDLENFDIACEAPSAERIVVARDDWATVTKCISSLPPQCGKVFSMRKIDGLSQSEIARQLGLSISTIEKHVIKGLRRCSDAIAWPSDRTSRTNRQRIRNISRDNAGAVPCPPPTTVSTLAYEAADYRHF
ncbi:RNA polymerase sigma factor [Novosphingobium sp. 9]|uniref:RNA polymerase sigma factor n=1 Tax=Novosphingobium sp. 9 TaxID=2025349 RepID=UPI0021B67B88|nr:RNA polymerase sigma factor [Novosphingobium sp. 9]